MASRIAQLCVIDALIAVLALADYDRSTETLRQTFDVLSLKRFWRRLPACASPPAR